MQHPTTGSFASKIAKGELGSPSNSLHTVHSCDQRKLGLMPGGREDQRG